MSLVNQRPLTNIKKSTRLQRRDTDGVYISVENVEIPQGESYTQIAGQERLFTDSEGFCDIFALATSAQFDFRFEIVNTSGSVLDTIDVSWEEIDVNGSQGFHQSEYNFRINVGHSGSVANISVRHGGGSPRVLSAFGYRNSIFRMAKELKLIREKLEDDERRIIGRTVEPHAEDFEGVLSVFGFKKNGIIESDREFLSSAIDFNGGYYLADDDGGLMKIDKYGNVAFDIKVVPGVNRDIYSIFSTKDGVYCAIRSQQVAFVSKNGVVNVISDSVGTNRVRAVVADKDGNVFTADQDGNVYKLDSEGTLLWTFKGHSSFVFGIHIDPLGNLYSCGHDDKVIKINENKSGASVDAGELTGAIEWEFTAESVLNDVRWFNNTIFASGNGKVTKLNSEGEEMFAVDSSGQNYRVRPEISGGCFIANDQNEVIFLDRNGVKQWVFDIHNDRVRGLDYDGFNLYTASEDGKSYVFEDEMQIKGFRIKG